MLWSALLSLAATATAFRCSLPKTVEHVKAGTDVGEPLLLTPYIESGDIKTAQKLALVTELTPNITSYSGFLTVDKACDSNLYFWFFPSQNKPETDPVTLWLEGGPGAPSILSLLTENGPYNLVSDDNVTLEEREYSWNRNSSLIYIDNPVGAGFSFTTGGCYSENQTHVAKNLLNGLEQFFELFPEYKTNDFYLSGESYAGKYVPATGYAIYKANSSINLKGILIGNGLVDPRNQANFSSYIYQLGLIDNNNRIIMADLEAEMRAAADAEEHRKATDLFNGLLAFMADHAGFTAFYNYLYSGLEPRADIGKLYEQASVRHALHLGNSTLHHDIDTYPYLYEDISISQRGAIEILLQNNYRVLLFNGQLDLTCPYPLMMDFVKLLKWNGVEEYKVAERKIWRVGNSLAGYVKSGGNFTEVLIRNAGHMVPKNQPEWSLELFNKFIFNKEIAE